MQARAKTVLIQTYRTCRLEVQDDGGDGWIVHVRDAKGAIKATLRNRVPSGLDVLLSEARGQVDRHAEGAMSPRW